MAQNLLTSYNYFVTSFIQLTFLSVGFWLLDVPHQIVKLFSKCFHNIQQRQKLNKKPFVDRYAFDLGYHSSYCLVTFMIMLQFAFLVPYVAIFAFFFFSFKYNVDKYNLTFVYNSEFRGRGENFKLVMPLSIFNVVLFQIILVGFFAINQVHTQIVLYSGIILVSIEVLVVVLIFKGITRRKR